MHLCFIRPLSAVLQVLCRVPVNSTALSCSLSPTPGRVCSCQLKTRPGTQLRELQPVPGTGGCEDGCPWQVSGPLLRWKGVWSLQSGPNSCLNALICYYTPKPDIHRAVLPLGGYSSLYRRGAAAALAPQDQGSTSSPPPRPASPPHVQCSRSGPWSASPPTGAGGGGLGPGRVAPPGNGAANGASPQPDGARSPRAAACGDSPGPASLPGGTGPARPGPVCSPLPAEPGPAQRLPAPASPGDPQPGPAPPPEALTRKAFRGHAGQDGGAQAVRGEGGGSSAAVMSAARRCSPPRALAGTVARGVARPRRGLGAEGGRAWCCAGRPVGRAGPGSGWAWPTPKLWVVPVAALYRDMLSLYVSVNVPRYRDIGVVSHRGVLLMHLTLVLPSVSCLLSVLLVPFCQDNFIYTMQKYSWKKKLKMHL